MNAAALSDRDREQLAEWLRFCTAHPGQLPPGFTAVQTRLIRTVGHCRLPGGGVVFLKVMGFPRRRDRLRYWLRALPAAHEAAMLRAAAQAAIPCPPVLGVAERRGPLGRPEASVLATAGLPVLPDTSAELWACSVLASRLLQAGIVHPDLHENNFVQLATGECAVLDLQSARCHPRRARGRAARIRIAGRLLAADWQLPELPQRVVEAGLISTSDLAAALHRAQRLRTAAVRRRVQRCLMESTEFTFQRRPWGTLVQRRTLPAGGQWQRGGRELIRVWLGARFCEVVDREACCLGALFLSWRWFPGRSSVYIAGADGVARFEEHRARWLDAYRRFKNMTGRRVPTLPSEAALPWSGHP